jgi:hypothetical protein
MKVSPVTYEEIQPGDYIVRVYRGADGTPEVVSGTAHHEARNEIRLSGTLFRSGWLTESGYYPLALQDNDNGSIVETGVDDSVFKVTV